MGVCFTGNAHMSLLLSTSTDSLVATGICKLGSLEYEITTGANELTLKPAAGEEIQGAAVVDYLLTIASVAQGEPAEQKLVSEWTTKESTLKDLNQHLTLRVFIGDGLRPTIADVKQFARHREAISKQKPNQRNEFPNVTRWFNHLQSLFEPHFERVPIKLVYTPPKKEDKPAADKKEKKGNPQQQRRQAPVKVTGIGRLQMKVGRITSIAVHEEVPSLYVEQIDLGEDAPRTVVSKLAEKVPIEQMKDRLVVVGANLQPAELQGVVSQGLVFCASIGEDVEVLTPPEGATVGEEITIEGVPTDFSEEVNRKVFSRAIKGLATNDECVACYKGAPLRTSKGVVTVSSLKGADIK